MLLDTGADVTLVPKSVIDDLGLDTLSEKRYELVGFDGSISLAPVVHIDLVFLERTFRGQFLVIDQEWGILGRNILNRMRLTFDGPQLTWDEFMNR
jgi:predicted aspartyl protease